MNVGTPASAPRAGRFESVCRRKSLGRDGRGCTAEEVGALPAPRPGSGLSLAWPIRAPSARRAIARRRDAPPRAKRANAQLARLKVRARLPRCPLTPLTPPRTRTARPKRKHHGPHTRGALGAALALHAAPCTRGQMRAQGRRASRRAPAGGAPRCCNGRSWPAGRSNWAAGRPPMGRRAPAAARMRGSRHRVRFLRPRFRVCVERGFYTVTAYELMYMYMFRTRA